MPHFDQYAWLEREWDRRETLIAVGVIVGTTSLALAGIRNLALTLPSVALPLFGFLAAGHLVGRKAGMTAIAAGLAGLFLAEGSQSGPAGFDWVIPGAMGCVAWVASGRVERRIQAEEVLPAVSARWMTVEVEMNQAHQEVAIPMTSALIQPREIHLQIARRRRRADLAKRA